MKLLKKMKKVIFLIGLAVFTVCCHAQNTDSINQVKDYVTAKLISQYLEKLPKEEDRINYEKIKERLNQNSIIKPIGNQELSDLLDKNGFKITNKTFVPKVEELKLDDMAAILTQIYSIPSNVTKDTGLKSELQTEITNFFVSPNATNPQEKNLQVTDKDVLPNSGSDDKNKDGGGFLAFNPNLWNILTVLAIVIFCISINNSIRNRKRRTTQHDQGSSHTDWEFSQLQVAVKGLEQRLYNLSNDVSNINKITHKPTVNYIKAEESQTQFDVKNAGDTGSGNLNISSRSVEPNVFFMLEPIDDVFSNNTKSIDYRKGFSMYKFFQKDNSSEATFEFISDDENIKIVRNNYLKSIRPACIMSNDANQNTSVVKTIERGIARLEGDNWKIVKKSTIKFE